MNYYMNLRLLKQLLDNALSSVSDEASSVANRIANNVDSYDTPSIRGLLGTEAGIVKQEPLEKSRLADIPQQDRRIEFGKGVLGLDTDTQEPLTTTRTKIRQALRNSLISNLSNTVTENDGTEAIVVGNPIAIRTGTDVRSNTQGDMRQTVTQVDIDKLSKNLPQIVIHDYKINKQGERYTIPITINNPDGTVNDSFTRRLSSMASGGEKEGYITTVNKDEVENLLVREQYGISVGDDNRYNPQTMWLVGEENVVNWKNGVPEIEFLDEARTIPKKRIVVRQAITTGRVTPVSETFSGKAPRNIESELVTTDEGDKYVSSNAGQWASSISTQKGEASILPNNVDDTVGQKILQSTIGDKTERYVIPYKTTGIKYYIDADKLKEEGFDPVTMGQQIAPTSDKTGADGTMGSTRPKLFGTRGLIDRLPELTTNETRTQTIYGVERTTIPQELLDKGDEDAILKYLNPRYLNRQEVISNNKLPEPATTTKKPSELGLLRSVPYTTSNIDDSTLSQVLSQFYTQRMDSTVRQELFNDSSNEIIPDTIPVKTLAVFNETSPSVIQSNGMDLSTINPTEIGTTTVTKRDVSDSTDVSAYKNLSAIGGEYETPVRTMIRKMHIDWISPTDVIENSKNPVTNQYDISQSDIENMILEQGKYFSSARRSSDKASKYKKALNDEYINLGVLENKIQSLQYIPNGELQIVELARANGIGVRDGDTIPMIQIYIKQRKGDVANKIDILSTTPFDKLDVSNDTHKNILNDAIGYGDVEWSVEHTHNGSMLADFYDYHSELQRLQQQGNQIESNEKITFLQGKINELLPKISIATSPINTAVVNPLNNSKVVNDRITGTTPNHKFRNENNQKLADLANGYFGKSVFPHFDNNGSVIPSHTKTYEDRWHYYIDDTTEAGNYGGYLNDNLSGDKLNQDRIIHISGDSNFHKGNIEFTYNGQATILTEDVLNKHFDNVYAPKLDEFARANAQIVLDNTDGINSRVRKYLVEKHGYQEIPLTSKSSKGKEYQYGYQLIHPSNPNFNIAPANQTPYQSKLAYNNKEVWIDKPLSTSKMTVKGKEINPLGRRLLLSSQDFSRAFYDNYGEAIDDGNPITSEVIRVYKQYVNGGGMLPDGKSMSKYPIQLQDGTTQEVNIFAEYNQIPKALPDSVIADMMIGVVPKSNTYTSSQVASFVARAENLEPVKNPIYALTGQPLDDLEDVVVVTLPRPYIEQHPNGNKFLTKLEEMSLLNLTKEATPKQQAQGFTRVIKYEPDDTYGDAITTVIDRQDYNKLLANNPNLSKVFIKRTGAIDEDTALKITNARSQLSGNKGQFTSVELQGKNKEGQANDNRLAVFNNDFVETRRTLPNNSGVLIRTNDSKEANVITRTDKEGNVINREYLGTPESERWYGEGRNKAYTHNFIDTLLDDTNDNIIVGDDAKPFLLTETGYRGVDTSLLPDIISEDIDEVVKLKSYTSQLDSRMTELEYYRQGLEKGIITPEQYTEYLNSRDKARVQGFLSYEPNIKNPDGTYKEYPIKPFYPTDILDTNSKKEFALAHINTTYRRLQKAKYDTNGLLRNKYANLYDYEFDVEPVTDSRGKIASVNLTAKISLNAKARLGNEISNLDNEIAILESKAISGNYTSTDDRKLNQLIIERANKQRLLNEGMIGRKQTPTSTKRLGTQQVGTTMGEDTTYNKQSLVDLAKKRDSGEIDNETYQKLLDEHLATNPDTRSSIDDMLTDRNTGLTARESGVSLKPIQYEFNDSDTNILFNNNRTGDKLNYFVYLPSLDADPDVLDYTKFQQSLPSNDKRKRIKIVANDDRYIYGQYNDTVDRQVPVLDKEGKEIISVITRKPITKTQKETITKTVAIPRKYDVLRPANLEAKPYSQQIEGNVLGNIAVNDENLVPYIRYGQTVDSDGNIVFYNRPDLVPLFPNQEASNVTPWIFSDEALDESRIISPDTWLEVDDNNGLFRNINESGTMSDVSDYESIIDNAMGNEANLSSIKSNLSDNTDDMIDDIGNDVIDDTYSESTQLYNDMYDITDSYVPFSASDYQSVIDVMSDMSNRLENYDTAIKYGQSQLAREGLTDIATIQQIADNTNHPYYKIAKDFVTALSDRDSLQKQYNILVNEYKLFESQYPQSVATYTSTVPITTKYNDAGEIISQQPSLFVQSDGTFSSTPALNKQGNPRGDNFNLGSQLTRDADVMKALGLNVGTVTNDSDMVIKGEGTLPLDLPFEGTRLVGLQTPNTNWGQFTQQLLNERELANANRPFSSLTPEQLKDYGTRIAQLSSEDINTTKQYLTNTINNQVNWFNKEARKARVSNYQELIDKTSNNVNLLRDKIDEVDTQLQQAYSIDPNSNQSISLLKQTEQLDIALKNTIAKLERYNAIANDISNNQKALDYLTTQAPVQSVDNLSPTRLNNQSLISMGNRQGQIVRYDAQGKPYLEPHTYNSGAIVPVNNYNTIQVIPNKIVTLPDGTQIEIDLNNRPYQPVTVLGNNQQLLNQAPTIPVGYNPQYQTERLLLPPANEADVTLSQVVNPTNQPVITVPVTGQGSNVVVPASIINQPSNIEAQIGNSSDERLTQAILNRLNQALNRGVGQPQQVNQSVSSNNNVNVTPSTPQVSQQGNQSVQGNTPTGNTSIPQENTPSNKVIITDNNGNRQLIDKALLPYLIGGGLTGGLIINDLFNRDDREANIRANL